MTSFVVESGGSNFELAPTGMHLARCYRIIDVGTQRSEYKGEVQHIHKLMLGWEIHGKDDDGKPLVMKDGRPFAMFKNYSLSWSEKANLRIDLQSWRGKPFSQEEMRRFDLKNVLDAWCMINVIEKQGVDGKMYVNVGSVTPVPAMIKQAGLPTGINKNEIFNLSTPDMEMFQGFSDNLKAKIMASPEWEKLQKNKPSTTKPVAFEDDGDIPF